MSNIFDILTSFFNITEEEEDINTITFPERVENSTKNPLISSIRKIPRDEMEEPEVEYIEN